ncbi:acyl transferase/acyl hydrolase/lysophospholipase [Flagelloscypha sp. PMI_526]|nr:acyl transferase/acyl hydrolase/lysophospholipase [Flagelloscypha sp. PMI_526]
MVLVTKHLDGGGFQTLSQLFILMEIMQRLQWKLKLDTVPLPCEHFDIIGGSGTGGIIALLLGRFRLPVEVAIERFISMYLDVFSSGLDKNTRSLRLVKVLMSWAQSAVGTKLLEANPSCKTFVCAMPSTSSSSTEAVCLFRSFRPRRPASYNCDTWEAARATIAHNQLFTPILIGPPWAPQSFFNSGLEYNNPFKLVYQETTSLYPSDTEFCFLSLGAGSPGITSALVEEEGTWAATLPLLAGDCERVADQTAKRNLRGYFRLNVSHDIKAHTSKTPTASGTIASHTQHYLQSVAIDRQVDDIVEHLVRRYRLSTGTSLISFFSLRLLKFKQEKMLILTCRTDAISTLVGDAYIDAGTLVQFETRYQQIGEGVYTSPQIGAWETPDQHYECLIRANSDKWDALTVRVDGGGFQSLSQLYILLEIMQRLHWKLKLDAVPLPCEHFDLIGGSGSGGIVALLIGRFRLPVEEAIELFIRIYQGVFSGAFDKLARSMSLEELLQS